MGFFIGCGVLLAQGNKFVLVREVRAAKKDLYNLPAGTLEVDEDLLECIMRETKEETGVSIAPEYFVGVYQTVLADGNNILFFVFAANAPANAHFVSSEHDVIEALTYDEIVALDEAGKLRAPSVRKSIEDFRAGRRYPLEAVQTAKYDTLAAITVGKD